jgi:hypothetical protein
VDVGVNTLQFRQQILDSRFESARRRRHEMCLLNLSIACGSSAPFLNRAFSEPLPTPAPVRSKHDEIGFPGVGMQHDDPRGIAVLSIRAVPSVPVRPLFVTSWSNPP